MSSADQFAYNFDLVAEDRPSAPLPSLPCSAEYAKEQKTDQFGYPIDRDRLCSCQSCNQLCKPRDWSQIIKSDSVVRGFQVKTVFLMAFLVLLVTLAVVYNKYAGNIKDRKEDLYQSFESYEQVKPYV